MQRVLDAFEGEPIDVFVVWIPAIPSDRYEATERGLTLITDERARHYWDGSQALGEAFAPVIAIRAKMAWDVYFVYGADASWGSSPPQPLHWMHQMFQEDPEMQFDEAKLEERVMEALDSGR